MRAALGGCASTEIAPPYVSPVAYQSYTYQQLAMEAKSSRSAQPCKVVAGSCKMDVLQSGACCGLTADARILYFG
jgi:hypothetical protein